MMHLLILAVYLLATIANSRSRAEYVSSWPKSLLIKHLSMANS